MVSLTPMTTKMLLVFDNSARVLPRSHRSCAQNRAHERPYRGVRIHSCPEYMAEECTFLVFQASRPLGCLSIPAQLCNPLYLIGTQTWETRNETGWVTSCRPIGVLRQGYRGGWRDLSRLQCRGGQAGMECFLPEEPQLS